MQGSRGRQLLITYDIGGSQKSQPYEAFSILVLDPDRNGMWAQAAFRAEVFAHQPRRMSFKALNDGLWRRALPSFLRLAGLIDGVFVTFAVDKMKRPQIEFDDKVREDCRSFGSRPWQVG